MRTRTYRNGNSTCRTYLKPVGFGWEVALICGGKPLFMGNFVHREEATRWYGIMSKEILIFTRKYRVAPRVPKAWYLQFLGTHLYKTYYHFLDKCFTKHTRTFGRASIRNLRKYRTLNRHWIPAEKTPFLRAA